MEEGGIFIKHGIEMGKWRFNFRVVYIRLSRICIYR